MLSFALAISTLAFVSVSSTEQASASTYWQDVCKSDDLCSNVVSYGMRVNSEAIRGATKLEIKSGAGVVSITSFNTIKALKRGEAVVYYYDKSGAETGKYLMYVITVQ
ncbi:hypothetical protein [Lysinibacillus sp. NPDC047702]|uniref:hypothetical protein n=1 Tax=unclassified Lysinibacillus TaxID=2636778 RepID=UPI003CFD8E76